MPPLWGWRDRNGYYNRDFPKKMVLGPGYSRGPFVSMEAAVEDARRITARDREMYSGEITVGHIRYLDPASYLPTVKDVLEEMDSHADRAGMLDPDEIGARQDRDLHAFRSSGGRQAARALKEALSTWSRRWIVPRIWTMKAVKTVKIR